MSSAATAPPARPGRELRADCSRCVALCCVAPPFAASSDFAIDKGAGVPCPNLRADLLCGIHADLRGRGFAGCATFDCFGAGQHVTQVLFGTPSGGGDWRDAPERAEAMFAVFFLVRQLNELLWYLTEALALDVARDVHGRARALADAIEAVVDGSPDGVLAADVAALRAAVDDVLVDVSGRVRSAAGRRGRDRRRGDLVGARLRGADLRGDHLRGALLLGADLREARLASADLLGADLRGADVRGADLAAAVFLTQSQVNAALGDAATTLTPRLERPGHWDGRRRLPLA